MLFMKMVNKRGPRIDHCCTPSSILHQIRSNKWLWINFIALKEKPYAFSLAGNKLYLRVSSALDRSINIVPTFLPLSRACLHFSIIFVKFIHEIYKRPLAFLENLSPRRRIPETAICWPFPFTDKANEIISLAISLGKLTDLRSLVPVCRTTRSAFFFQIWAYIMFHDLV